MIEIPRILCPVDFSEFSRHALKRAVVLARRYESDITVLHACTLVSAAAPAIPYGTFSSDPFILPAERREEVVRALDEFVRPLVPDDVTLQLRVVEGPAVDQIVSVAAAIDAGLIVMGTHGRSGFERLLLGSVTEKVLRKTSCPVLTVPPRAEGLEPQSFTRLVCAVDFSPSSLRALDYALSLAQEASATLTVLHVLDVPPAGETYDLPGFNVREYEEALASSARKDLAAAIPQEARDYCTIEERIVTGRPYREILRVADERQADLIVMGIQGRGVVDLVFFGSTTQHVLRQARCAVLTLRP